MAARFMPPFRASRKSDRRARLLRILVARRLARRGRGGRGVRLRGLRHRDQIVAAALERLATSASSVLGVPTKPVPRRNVPRLHREPPRCGVPASVDPDLAADFLALGHCHLQVELLTRKFRYMSNLDEHALRTSALAAAGEAVAGDAAAARQHLQSAFDRLHEAREYFYPLEARLLDLTLVAPSTLGQALRDELADGLPRNLLVSGEVIEEMARREPETLDALKQALAAGSVALVGGERSESPLPLLDPGSDRRPSLPRIGGLSGVVAAAARDLRPPPFRADAHAAASAPPPGLRRRAALHARRRPLSHRRPEPGFNGKGSTARPSSRSAACRSTPAGRNRSSRSPRSWPTR